MSYMTSDGSPTPSPPIAYASKPISTVCRALSSRRSGNTLPCTIPNCAWPGLVTATAGPLAKTARPLSSPSPRKRAPARSPPARDQVIAGPQVQMIRVAEQDLGAERLEIAVRDPFDGALGAHRHECWRLHVTVRRRHPPTPRAPVGVRHVEPEGCHR